LPEESDQSVNRKCRKAFFVKPNMSTKKKILSLAISAAIIIAAVVFGSLDKSNQAPEIIFVKKGILVEKVDVTGNIKPADEVELSFEKAGKVYFVYVAAGDKVKTGQILAMQSNADLAAQLKQAEANVASAKAGLLQYQAALDSQKAKLAEYQKGSKPEEIQLAETGLRNAKRALLDAETNLADVEITATAALNEDYSAALTAVLSAETTAENALLTITDIQTKYYSGTDKDANLVADKKAEAVLNLLGAGNAGRYNKDELNKLNAGTKALVKNAEATEQSNDIAAAIISLKASLLIIKNCLTQIPLVNLSAADLASVSAEKVNIDSEITTLNSKEQAIAVQKVTNENNITAAKINVTTAKNNVDTARDQLTLKKSGYTAEQIAGQAALVKQAEANAASQEAQIKYAEANAANIQAQIGKTIIRSPLNGTVAEVNVKAGEISSLTEPSIKIISDAKFQIETNIPEADIAKVNVGAQGEISLDALGAETKFNVRVIKIAPAEKIIEGVPTYLVTLELENNDPRVKPGMSADIALVVNKKENVLLLPGRAIKTSNGDKYVLLIEKDGTTREKKIETAGRDDDGNVEIIAGLVEGEKIIVPTEK
jgi:HlyD family secretion protein